MGTINTPAGEPYLSVERDNNLVKIQMHAYTKQRAGKVFFVIDIKALPAFIKELTEINDANP